ncbi:hypothetical protein JSY36_13910 [Bacillus sp. H-16]|nr:hypothetical protein [Alteribacter salitolerans]
MVGSSGRRRLQREKQQLKTPQRSEEAEALPAESVRLKRMQDLCFYVQFILDPLLLVYYKYLNSWIIKHKKKRLLRKDFLNSLTNLRD